MKKTMFITSVIMVVVMAIALTTSSLAWFTSQGGNTATTTALTITAATEASGGIQISKTSPRTGESDAYVWDITASLATNNTYGGMKPLVPDANCGTNAATGAQLLAALSAENGSATYLTPTPTMLGNYIGTNGVFAMDRVENAQDKKYTDGYFVKDVWVTNIASGANAKAVQIAPTVTFPDYTPTPGTDDALLWVAVLGWTGTTDATDASDEQGGAWEIVALTPSRTAAAVRVGKGTDYFDAGDSVNGATTTISTSEATWIKGTSTGTVAAIGGDGAQDVKHYRIVAWYDGALLYNNNSGISIPFVVTFTATDYTPANNNNG